LIFRVFLTLFGLSLALAPELATAAQSVTGLPLPRFVSTKSTPINVRVGPGTRYDVAWIYMVAGTPVEVIQEFDTWRKIRDVDGSEGWVHQNMLSGVRSGYVAANLGDKVAIRTSAEDGAGPAAWVSPGFPVKIQSCDGNWCNVLATDHPAEGKGATYSGYLPERALWGVYKDEHFD
jgi:SH3-like domain-containing protein